MTLMIPLEEEEIGLPQRGTLRLTIDLDVLPPHSPCFCQGTDQPDMLPGKELERYFSKILLHYGGYEQKYTGPYTYFPCIV